MSTTDNADGFLSSVVVDPSFLLSSIGSINLLRQISLVVQTISDRWNGVASAGVSVFFTRDRVAVRAITGAGFGFPNRPPSSRSRPRDDDDDTPSLAQMTTTHHRTTESRGRPGRGYAWP
jgi:hypothetical protein